jgi:ATP-binding cassette subfamily F protein 3
MVTKIVELYQQQLHFYSGNYSFYETEKAMRLELQQRAYENQQDYIRQQERFVERFKAKASKAAQAQSIVKRLEKLDRIEEAGLERPSIRINFRVDRTPGKIVSTLRNVTKRFGNLTIVEDASAEIERGDKIALIGANGKGKSTLLRIIAGTEPVEGTVIPGHNVVQSFYAQHQLESLRLDHTLIQEMANAGSQRTELELRTLLGCFLFSGDDADKRIKVLSGGEKSRVALAKTIISQANFLLLDEPTNHLDMVSVDLLIEALDRYEGTLILVSHDRHFIAKTANKIWSIEDGRIVEFKGGYEEWVEWRQRMQQPEPVKKAPPAATQQKEPVKAEKNAHATTVDKERQKEQRRLERKFQEAEEILNGLQKERTEVESMLADPMIYSDASRFRDTEKRYQELTEKTSKAEKEYERLFEALASKSD